VRETDEGVLRKPVDPFPPAHLDDVAGMLKGQVKPRSDREIEQALEQEARRRWRGGN